MIRRSRQVLNSPLRKPRASGDDPDGGTIPDGEPG